METKDVIFELRTKSGLSQDALAEKIHVTRQAVSRWETGESYPDITVLPSIANFFEITIDEFLGNDKVRNERKIKEYCEKVQELTGNGGRTGDAGEYGRALALAKKAYAEFPDECSVIMLYVTALKIYSKEEHSAEIKRLCEKVVKSTDDPRLLADASHHLYGFRSVEDRAYFVENFISYGEDSKWFEVYPRHTEEGKILHQHCVLDKWWYLNAYIDLGGDFFEEQETAPVTHEEKILLLKKCQAIFYALFDKDDLGEFVFYEGQYNEFLCREYLHVGNIEEVLAHFEMAVDGWVRYNELPEKYEYHDILYAYRPYVKAKLDGPYMKLSRYRGDIDRSSLYDAIRNDERFKSSYIRLCEG